MSVIHDCQPGDEFVCLAEFVASPNGERFSWQTSRKFHIGERLRYISSRQDAYFKDRPIGWHVVFEATDGKVYAATRTYFVTEDDWRRIEEHFCQTAAKD